MKEKTFLLFKPNRYNTRDVYNYVCEELRKKGLIIEKSYQKKLSEEHIKRLWPRQSKDQILLNTFLIMCDEETTIIEICGDNAIDIVYRIKKTVRTIYATGIIRNCIHAPIDNEEYENQIRAIYDEFSNDIEKKHEMKNVIENVNIQEKLAVHTLNISMYTMIHATIPYENSDKKYRFFLAEDDIHHFSEYICFIHDIFIQFDWYMSTTLATILETYGEVCLIDTDEFDDANKLIESARMNNMKIVCHEVRTICK